MIIPPEEPQTSYKTPVSDHKKLGPLPTLLVQLIAITGCFFVIYLVFVWWRWLLQPLFLLLGSLFMWLGGQPVSIPSEYN